MRKQPSAALNEMAGVVKTMSKDIVLSDVLEAYDATERALNAARQYGQWMPPGLDLAFRLKGVHEHLFRIRADLEEL
jgi:hypothetical protein